MVDVNWDLAPEGADRVVVRFYNGDEMSCKKVIQRPTQKTVADAVEYINDTMQGRWFGDYNYLCYRGDYHWFYSDKKSEDVVCTREQFEAYAVEQEGEKWTHTYNELKCRTLIHEPDREGYIVIVNELNEYYCVDDDELKPIKPTISESRALELMKTMCPDEWAALDRKYDII